MVSIKPLPEAQDSPVKAKHLSYVTVDHRIYKLEAASEVGVGVKKPFSLLGFKINNY